MRRRGILVLFLGIGFVFTAFGLIRETLQCSPPQVNINGECCIDADYNGVCDELECLPRVTYARNASGYCTNFSLTCVPKGWVKVRECPKGTCVDGIQNCHDGGCETGVDFGGPCREESVPTCYNQIQDLGEMGVDCGGPCPPCFILPLKPTCFDGTQNQGEDGVDCGGPCMPCLPSCSDGVQNQGEEDVDCGGPCVPCYIPMTPLWNFTLSAEEKSITDVAMDSNGTYIVVGSEGGVVHFLDENATLRWSYKTRGGVTGVGVSESGNYVAAGSEDNFVYFFKNASDFRVSSYFNRFRLGSGVKKMFMDLDGDTVAVGYDVAEKNVDETVIKTGYMFFFNGTGDFQSKYGLGKNIRDVAMSRGGDYTAAVSFNTLYLDVQPVDFRLKYALDNIEHVAVSDLGYAALSTPTTVYLANKDNGVLWEYKINKSNSIDVSNSRRVVVGVDRVYMLNSTGKPVWTYDAGHPIALVVFSGSGYYVAAASEDRHIHILDNEGRLLWKYFVGEKVTAIRFSAAENRLAVGTYSGTLIYFSL